MDMRSKPAREMTRAELERELARIPYRRRHGARYRALATALSERADEAAAGAAAERGEGDR
jgi:hypothetical protein